MRYKSCTAILLASAVFVSSVSVNAALKPLTIGSARSFAVNNSSGMRSAVTQIVKKQIELRQAQEAINDIRRKETTWRFSLLFSLKMPERHGLPKEIELVMKMPEIQSELRTLGKKEINEKLKSEIQAELAFYDVLMAEHNVDYYTKRVDDAKKTFESVEKQYKLGEGKKQDVDYMASKITAAEKSLQSSILTLATAKRKLSAIIGIDVSTSYSFTEYLPQVNIKREDLPKILSYSMEHDFGLYQAVEARKVAQMEVNELLNIYRSQYGGYINDVQNYIYMNRNGHMDYRQFIQKYNHALTMFDSPWAGDYTINFIFFKIHIPKEWFKGSFSGTRYLEDQKYALFVSLVELDLKKEEEAIVRKELEQIINDTYETLKIMERALLETRENLSFAEKTYEDAYQSNLLNITSFTELESIRESLYEQQKSLYEMRIDYAKELSSFDLRTSGYIREKMTNVQESADDYASGISFTDKPEWYIHNFSSDYNFIFGVKIPEDFGVTEYELCYKGLVVGGKKMINEEITHLPLTYANNSIMVLKLYDNGKLKYFAYFDGGEYGGELNLIEVDAKQKAAGICTVSTVNELMSQFTVTLNDDYDYDTYVLLYEGTEFASGNKDTAISSLNMYFASTELLEMRLYKGDKIVKYFSFEPLERGENVQVAVILEK